MKTYKFEGEEFEVVETSFSLKVRLLGKEAEGGVYGSVVQSGSSHSPFEARLLNRNGRYFKSQSAHSVEDALQKARSFVMSYQEPNSNKAWEEIQKFYEDLPDSGS